jgi:hypothetical protein
MFHPGTLRDALSALKQFCPDTAGQKHKIAGQPRNPANAKIGSDEQVKTSVKWY